MPFIAPFFSGAVSKQGIHLGLIEKIRQYEGEAFSHIR
jgi:hypothetical protein